MGLRRSVGGIPERCYREVSTRVCRGFMEELIGGLVDGCVEGLR